MAPDTELRTSSEIVAERVALLAPPPGAIIAKERPPLLPIRDYLVVEPLPKPTHTEGGLVIPGNTSEETTRAVIVRRGEEVAHPLLTPGAVVACFDFSGMKFKEGDKERRILKITEIVGVEASGEVGMP